MSRVARRVCVKKEEAESNARMKGRRVRNWTRTRVDHRAHPKRACARIITPRRAPLAGHACLVFNGITVTIHA